MPVTVTLNWHWLFAPIAAPARLIPVGEVVVRVPPQTVEVEPATDSPVGSTSVNDTPASATGLAAGLVSVNCNDVVAFGAIVVGVKALAIVGGATTVMVSVAVPPVPPSKQLTVLVVLTCAPAVIPVTLTEKVHEEPAAGAAVNVPPDKLTVDGTPGGLLIAVVIVPLPHEPVTVVDANFSPPGKVSENTMPLRPVAILGLVRVKLNVSD